MDSGISFHNYLNLILQLKLNELKSHLGTNSLGYLINTQQHSHKQV